MSFLDNSGDIILDAVLTDTGRFRLAKGDGSFRIVKFALGDDEINYKLFDKNNTNGSAYYDLQILQTPVLEAFTNNASTMKSKLVSIPRTNLLYLPTLKINDVMSNSKLHSSNTFVVAVDERSESTTAGTGLLGTDRATSEFDGVLLGANPGIGPMMAIDHGLDTTEISPSRGLDPDLVESVFIVEMDNRLGTLLDGIQSAPFTPAFIDDDNIATYYITMGGNSGGVTQIPVTANPQTSSDPNQVIRGPRGNRLQLRIRSSLELQSSTFLFTQIGSTLTTSLNGISSVKVIDSIIKVTGATTGASIDIPVRYAKVP